jgi:hypothetical protein
MAFALNEDDAASLKKKLPLVSSVIHGVNFLLDNE